jgi:hypothetical protein
MPGAIVYEQAVGEDLALGVGQVLLTAPGGGFLRGNRINLSTLGFLVIETWAPGTLAAGALASLDVAVVGARVGDYAVATYDTSLYLLTPGLLLYAKVTADDTVTVVVANLTADTVNLTASGNLVVISFPIPHGTGGGGGEEE